MTESKIEKLMKEDGWSVRHTKNAGVEYTSFVKGDILIDEDDISIISEEQMNKVLEIFK